MPFLILWIAFSLIPASIASKKGRSGAGWFFLSLLISPLLAGIIVACMEPLTKNIETAAIRSGQLRKCPFCAETIKHEAIICRYCGKDLKASGPIMVNGLVIKE